MNSDKNILIAPSVGNGLTETSPLLQVQVLVTGPNGAQTVEHWAEHWEAAVVADRTQTTWQREAKTIAIWSMPLLGTYVLQRSINMVGVFSVGRLGTTELGAVSLATVTTNMIGNTLIQGLANSLDTLAAQAYGSGNKHLVGLHMQRMICFIFLCVVPLMILWWKAGEILAFIIPDRQVAELAGVYLKVMILRVPAFVLFECGKRFLQAQGLFSAATYVLVIAAPLNALVMWLFVWHFGWGFVGAPIAIAITENLMAVLLFLYIWLIDGSQCWGGFSGKVFSNWGPMIRLALPGMIMHVSEFAADEILTLAAAQFGTSQLAAQSVLVTLTQITWTLPLALSIASSIRIANWIGAKATNAAKISAIVAVVFGLIISAFNTVILASLRYKLPLLFTQDTEVVDIVVKAFAIVTIMQSFDAMAAISHGLLRGLGCQGFGGYVNLVAYYVFAIPISFGTAFLLGWQVYGLWTGMTTGLCIVTTVELWWVYHSDWDNAVEDAERRNESG